MTTPTLDLQQISFSVALPPRALRRNSETRSVGWRSKLRREWQEEVWCAGREWAGNAGLSSGVVRRMPWPRAAVHYTWRSASVPMDVDNIIATCKPALDVLKSTGPRPLGIVRDDSPDCVSVSASWAKAKHRVDEAVEIRIVKIEEVSDGLV